MKFLFIFSIGLAVLSSIAYHLTQKLTPQAANPALSLTITYLVAAAGSLLLLVLYPLQNGLAHGLRQMNWTSVGLGLVILGIEMGFLLAYRAGWNISVANLMVNTSASLLLIPIGLAFFKEKLTPVNLIGILVTLVGLILVNRK